MRAKLQSLFSNLLLLAPLLLLASCDWVDSAGGSSSATASIGSTTTTEIFVEDQPVVGASSINEQSEANITVARQTLGADLSFEWSEEPIEQGNLAACEGLEGFNSDFAADTLEQSCKTADDCGFNFEAVSPDGSDLVEFLFAVPALDADVGVVYELSVTDANGGSTVTAYDFCLIAINEAPTALDDTFTVVEGDTLIIDASSIDNLLTNDEDDTDVTNQPLTINTEPARAPQFDENFILASDGGFTYHSSPNPEPVDRSDSFDYVLTDGAFEVTATATIRIVSVNRPPSLDAPLAPLMATEGVAFRSDLAPNFVDPEAGPVTFSLSATSPLAVGTGLSLSTAGVLSGTPTAADVGSYVLVILASDGLLTTQVTLSLEVAPAPLVPPTNATPEFVLGSVASQSISLNQSMVPIRPLFNDTQTLSYSINGASVLPIGVTINAATGVISGVARERGVFSDLRVRATDPSGAFALSSAFTLTVTLF